MEIVSTLDQLALRGSTYIFILVRERNLKGELQKALDRWFEEFGRKGGLAVRAVRATEESRDTIHLQLRRKPWPEKIRHRIKTEELPFLVIIRSDFDEFRPEEDEWRIVWLGEAKNPRERIPTLLDAFERDIKGGRNLFEWLDDISSATGLSPYGGVSSPHTLASAKIDKKVGRPGIFDLEYGATETIDDIVRDWTKSDAEIPRFKHGWRTDFVREMRKRNRSLRDNFSHKAVYDRLIKSKIFRGVQQRFTRPEH
jgi:hypothetical protein